MTKNINFSVTDEVFVLLGSTKVQSITFNLVGSDGSIAMVMLPVITQNEAVDPHDSAIKMSLQ